MREASSKPCGKNQSGVTSSRHRPNRAGTVLDEFSEFQKKLDRGELRRDSPEFEEIRRQAEFYGFYFTIPANQMTLAEILAEHASAMYRTDLDRVLRWMKVPKAERENVC